MRVVVGSFLQRRKADAVTCDSMKAFGPSSTECALAIPNQQGRIGRKRSSRRATLAF
jgi:hypothetical protein